MTSYTRPNSNALDDAMLSRRNFLKIAAAAAAPAITGGFGFFSHASSQSRGSDAHADLIVINAK
ncbi:MAG: twin-arginine translocation signal domain-containing protein, partial [Deltaproteobacteria bacterium]|nr:twin-arginine translocation signal domain-containing protein [Deltaproteobacteria bacterium]